MKARKRGSNDEWQEVQYIQLRDSYTITQADQMEFDVPSNNGCTEDDHWQDARERAAIAALGGLLSTSSGKHCTPNDIAKWSIDYADALIEQFKRK